MTQLHIKQFSAQEVFEILEHAYSYHDEACGHCLISIESYLHHLITDQNPVDWQRINEFDIEANESEIIQAIVKLLLEN